MSKVKTKKKTKSKWKIALKFLGLTLLVLTLIGIIIGGYIGYKLWPTLKSMSAEADKIIANIDEDTFKRLDPTVIIRPDGGVVREYKHAPYNYLKIEDIPKDIKDAFVSIEDKNFYKHKGVDLKANLRAAKALISNKGKITQGASTITQQLVKLTFLTNEQTYNRKLQEVIIAYKLEQEVSKDKILEYYINSICYGNGVYGISAAAELYFSKNVNDLTLAESTFLTAIPNNPTIYNPMNNHINTIKRRNRILKQMALDEIISESLLKETQVTDVELNVKEKDKYIAENYEITYVMSSAVKAVMETEGFEHKFEFNSNKERNEYNKEFQEVFEETNERVRAGGYTITSTIDPEKQAELQKSVNDGLKDFKRVDKAKGIYETQGAAVTIDNKTHEVVAIVGGRTAKDQENTYNRAYLSHRQPGSVIKPIIAYGVEIDEGMLGSKVYIDKKYPRGPRNVTGKYMGRVKAKEALQRSINTIPFRMIETRGAKPAHEYMAKMEFSKVIEQDNNAGIAIGGFTYGTTPLEIAGAFGTLANDGKYVRPMGIRTIKFKEDIIYENNGRSITVYKDGTAYLLTEMLQGVITEKWGTGKDLGLNRGMPAAIKTGTTNENKDGWLAGYTPYYTTAVWVGNDTPKPIKGLYGSTAPGEIWKSYMNKIHKDLKVIKFEMPKGTKKMYVNLKTGDISDVKKPGYTSYETVPKAYIDKIEFEKAEAARLKEEERLRKLEEERIRKKMFFDKYGVEEDVELKHVDSISTKIKTAVNMRFANDNDYETAVNLLNRASAEIINLVVLDNKIDLEAQIEKGLTDAEVKKKNMHERIKREEEERIEKERLEKIRKEEEKLKEEERLKQEKIDEEKRREEEKRLEEEKRKEEERLEQEEKEKEENDKNNGTENEDIEIE